ncbi:MAG: hypothetical protein H0W84_04340 [Bacteroidetes bacterium]|nr:hypothetical protein [Bacteroidota bacterium]
MVDTTIYIGSVAIHEPVTAFSDFMITAIGLSFYYKLRKKSADTVIGNWRVFFGLLGLSTLLGGCAHAFFEIHEGLSYKIVWLTMQIVNGIAIYFAQQATLNSVLVNSQFAAKWKTSYILQLIIFISVLLFVQKYVVTIVENVIGFIPVMLLHFTFRSEVRHYKKIGYGILVSFITAIVHGTKFSIHSYFNYNDIAHIFIMVSLFFMYQGAKEITTSSPLP